MRPEHFLIAVYLELYGAVGVPVPVRGLTEATKEAANDKLGSTTAGFSDDDRLVLEGKRGKLAALQATVGQEFRCLAAEAVGRNSAFASAIAVSSLLP